MYKFEHIWCCRNVNVTPQTGLVSMIHIFGRSTTIGCNCWFPLIDSNGMWRLWAPLRMRLNFVLMECCNANQTISTLLSHLTTQIWCNRNVFRIKIPKAINCSVKYAHKPFELPWLIRSLYEFQARGFVKWKIFSKRFYFLTNCLYAIENRLYDKNKNTPQLNTIFTFTTINFFIGHSCTSDWTNRIWVRFVGK